MYVGAVAPVPQNVTTVVIKDCYVAAVAPVPQNVTTVVINVTG